MVQKRRKVKKGRRVIAALLTIIVVAAAILVFLYRDELFGSGIDSEVNSTKASEPYTYEHGAKQQFALMGGSLAISSSTGLQILDKDGYSVFRQIFSMKEPSVAAGDKHCIFYDVGGTSLRLYSEGEVLELDTEGRIISVSMNSSGYFALTCEESGYKGSVTVFNGSGEPVYKWYSGTGYVLDAAVSPDSRSLTVLSIESTGSVIHLFKLGNEDEAATVYLPDELAFKLAYTGNSAFCTLSEDALHFFSASGENLSVMDFEGGYLVDYQLSDKFCAVALSKYVSGSSVILSSLSDDGNILGTTELSYTPLSMSASKNRLLILGSGMAAVLSREMGIISETEIPAGYGSAVYLPDGDALLLSSSHGEIVDLK